MKAGIERKSAPDVLEKLIQGIGHTVCWVNVLLVLIIVLQVLLRYVFGRGLVMLEELEWHLYAAGFLFGLSYAVTIDSNIRMDLIHRHFSERNREWLEAIGILILLMPFVIVILLHSFEFAKHSWVLNERSEAPLGLPCRWIIKSVIPISFGLLAVAGVTRLIRAFQVIRKEDTNGCS